MDYVRATKNPSKALLKVFPGLKVQLKNLIRKKLTENMIYIRVNDKKGIFSGTFIVFSG